MAEQIITKKCCYCKEVKSLTEFYKNKCRKDGYQIFCKICNTIRALKYSQTKKWKIYAHRYRQSKKDIAKQRIYIKQLCARFPRFLSAMWAIQHAVSKGNLPKVSSLLCHFCSKPAQHYHHHLGYSYEHQLDVLPLCVKCHRKAHKSNP